MRFSTQQHPFYCGIALHARTMSRCLLNREGESCIHRTMPAGPAPFLKAIAPDREDLVVCVAGLFTWDWLADLCPREGIPCVLGHALSLQALHGGKTTHDKIDAQKSAGWLRGGLLPQAYVYPAAMRATRARLRRRTHLRRKRAAWLAHLHNTTRPDTLPVLGQKSASKAHRDGGAERLPEPAVPKSRDGALALLGHDAQRLRDVELASLKTAKPHHAQPLSLRRTVPGLGESLRWVLPYAIQAIARFPRVQACLSSCCLVPCTQESAGKRYGTAGTKSGHAHLKGAFAEAAVLLRREHPAGQ
jgi:transposase